MIDTPNKIHENIHKVYKVSVSDHNKSNIVVFLCFEFSLSSFIPNHKILYQLLYGLYGIGREFSSLGNVGDCCFDGFS